VLVETTMNHDHPFFCRVARRVALALAATLTASLVACAPVASYERGTLAHPTMTTEDVSTDFDGHVRAVSEGASGGLGGGGGGCGCN
jgi:hypothetical protein